MMMQNLPKQLQEYAGNPGYSHGDYADTMRQAAVHIKSLEAELATLRARHSELAMQLLSEQSEAMGLYDISRPELIARINAALGDAFKSDQMAACRAQDAIAPFIRHLAAPAISPAPDNAPVSVDEDIRAENEMLIARQRNALQRIARWHGEFPATGDEWPDGSEVSYGAAFGSNGERDYMRQVALGALSAPSVAAPTIEPACRPPCKVCICDCGGAAPPPKEPKK